MTIPQTVNSTAPGIATDADLDAQGPAADLVRVYLNGIGRTALLTAAEEVELAKRIEAGVFARHTLDAANTGAGQDDSAEKDGAEQQAEPATKLTPQRRRDLAAVVRDGEIAKNHLLEANLRLVVSLAKRYTGRSCPPCTARTGFGN